QIFSGSTVNSSIDSEGGCAAAGRGLTASPNARASAVPAQSSELRRDETDLRDKTNLSGSKGLTRDTIVLAVVSGHASQLPGPDIRRLFIRRPPCRPTVLRSRHSRRRRVVSGPWRPPGTPPGRGR